METKITEEQQSLNLQDDRIDETIDIEDILVWNAPEYTTREKGPEWFLAVGIIAIASAISAFIYSNMLFGILIIIGTTTLVLFSIRKPEKRTFTLTPSGIMVDEEKYSYKKLESFWVTEHDEENPKIIIQSKNIIVHHLSITNKGHRP